MEKKVDSTLTSKSGEVVIGGKKYLLRYLGEETNFNNLIKEVIEYEVYKPGLGEKNDIILDIGGYVGESALYFAQYAKKIYVLEPSIQAYELMLDNLKRAKPEAEIIPLNLALDNYDGEGRIFCIGEDDVGATLMGYTPKKKSFPVKTIRLDTLMKEYGIEHVDLLKMDIEGLEYRILDGEAFNLVADKIYRIIVEVHPFGVPGSAGGDPFKIPYLLRRAGFKTEIIKNSKANWMITIITSDGRKEQRDVVMVLGKRK